MKENVGSEELGKPKSHFMGNPTVLFFLYKYREYRQEEGLFPSYIGRHIVRRTISFCNKLNSLTVGESLVECSNVMPWIC